MGEVEKMSYRADLGFQVGRTLSGENNNSEHVILKDYYHPEGEDIHEFIKEDTNYISEQLINDSQEVGYIPKAEDKVISILIARTSDFGIYPSNRRLAEQITKFNETKAVLIRGDKEYKILISKSFGGVSDREKKNFYVEVGTFLHQDLNKYYTCKLFSKNSKGGIKSNLFSPRNRTDYDKLMSQERDIDKNFVEIVGSAIMRSQTKGF